ncbi:hypothetical protein D1007_62069 [Hordeum vulgare]|nr:hypothetical protein D1007_62069 [Hordeum vulgare]
MYYDNRYTVDFTLWDTWLRNEHDVRRASYFAGTVSGPRRPLEARRRTRVRGLAPTSSPSPSPSPPPPPRMTAQEEAWLMQRVMEYFMMTHDERQWPGLEDAMALSVSSDVVIHELVKEEEVMEDAPVVVPSGSGGPTMELVVHGAGDGARSRGVNWCPTPPRSPERDVSPREEVLHAPASFQPAPAPTDPGPPLDATGLRRPHRHESDAGGEKQSICYR